MAVVMMTSNLDKKHQENIITFVVVILEINYFVMVLKLIKINFRGNKPQYDKLIRSMTN